MALRLQKMADEVIVEQPALNREKIVIILLLQMGPQVIESLRERVLQSDAKPPCKGRSVNAIPGS